MMTAKMDPLKDEGARMERTAVRRYLRRRLKEGLIVVNIGVMLEWIDKRRKRYDKASGGLGRR